LRSRRPVASRAGGSGRTRTREVPALAISPFSWIRRRPARIRARMPESESDYNKIATHFKCAACEGRCGVGLESAKQPQSRAALGRSPRVPFDSHRPDGSRGWVIGWGRNCGSGPECNDAASGKRAPKNSSGKHSCVRLALCLRSLRGSSQLHNYSSGWRMRTSVDPFGKRARG